MIALIVLLLLFIGLPYQYTKCTLLVYTAVYSEISIKYLPFSYVNNKYCSHIRLTLCEKSIYF